MLWLVPVPNGWHWVRYWNTRSPSWHPMFSVAVQSLFTFITTAWNTSVYTEEAHLSIGGGKDQKLWRGEDWAHQSTMLFALLWNSLPWRIWGKSHNRSWGFSCFENIGSYTISSCPILSQNTTCGIARKRRSQFGEDKPRVERNLRRQDHRAPDCCWMSAWQSVMSRTFQSLVYLGASYKAWRAPPECWPPYFCHRDYRNDSTFLRSIHSHLRHGEVV